MSRGDDVPMNTPDDEMFRAEWDADGHVSEDTVHAWLDRQLGESDASAVETHVASCGECAELVAEARGLKAATSRIIGSLDVIAGGIVPSEDVARTASHIVALANAAEKSERARVVVAKKKFWQNPVVLRAAAAVVVMVGATTLVMRKYSPTTLQMATADSVVSTVSVAPVASNVPVSDLSTASATSAAAELNKASQKFKAEARAKTSSARAEREQRASVIANADSTVAKKMGDAVGKGAVSNAGSAAPPAATLARSLPVSPPAPARVLAEATTSADKSRADSAVAAGTTQAFARVGGGRGGAGGRDGRISEVVGRAASGIGSVNALKAMSDTSAASKAPITIVGTVRDDGTGRPLAQASVMIPGTTIGTMTSNSGTFILKEVPRGADSLVARSLGYQSVTSSIATSVRDTAHAAFNLKARAQASQETASARFSGAQATVSACELRVVPTSANPQPIFRSLLGQFFALGNQSLTVVGWPAPNDSVVATMTRTLDRLSFHALKNGAQLDVQLTKFGESWSGTAEERSGGAARKENVELTTNGAASCAK